MHLLLTDRLSCPRCGPAFGLILLAREVRDRRIIHGDFGCSNCRDTYPVESGFGDLRAPPRTPFGTEPAAAGLPGTTDPDGSEGTGTEEDALRFAALMGVTEGPGTVLMKGPAAANGPAVARLVEGVEVVGIDPILMGRPETPGLSRLVAEPGIPFFSGTFRAVLLSGPADAEDLGEGVRVLASAGRLVLLNAPPGGKGLMEGLGLKVILEEGSVLVGRRVSRQALPLVGLRGP